MAKPELVNAVGGGNLSQEIDLEQLYETIDGEEVRYDPEHWPGLYLRFTTESPAVLVFRTGKYNIAGADSLEELFDTNEEFLARLQALGITNEESSFEVRNLVFLEQYNRELDLEAVTVALGLEDTEYEPEQFPSIQFCPSDITGTFLIFRSGKVILTGANSSGDAAEAFADLFSTLDGLFR